MSTPRQSFLAITSLLVVLTLCGARAVAAKEPSFEQRLNAILNDQRTAPLFDDDRLREWAAMYNEGRFRELLDSLEIDLSGPHPSPHVAYIWCTTHQRRRTLDLDRVASLPEPARARVRPLAEALLHIQAGDDLWTLKNLPPASIDAEHSDPWTLYTIARQAEYLNETSLALDYLKLLLARWPDFYPAAPLLTDVVHDDQTTASAIRELVGTPRLRNRAIADFVGKWMEWRADAWSDEDEASNATWGTLRLIWLEWLPGDPLASEDLAWTLYRMERHDQAATIGNQCARAFPFNGWSSSGLVVSLLRLGREEEARRIDAQGIALADRLADGSEQIEANFAMELTNEGNHGRARQVLDAALQRWPDDHDLHLRYAELEQADGRLEEALRHATAAVGALPLSVSANKLQAVLLMDLNRPAEAERLLTDVVHRLSLRNVSLEGSLAIACAKGSNWDRWREVSSSAIEAFPKNSFLLSNYYSRLPDVNQRKQAIEGLAHLVDRRPTHTWTLSRLISIVEEENGAQGVQDCLADLQSRFAWVQSVWQKEADRLSGRDSAPLRADVWRRARRQSRALWADIMLANVLWETEATISEGRAILANALVNPAYMQVPGRCVALRGAAWSDMLHMRIQRIPRETLVQKVQDLDEWRQAGAFMSNYHRYRSELFAALGRRTEAIDEMMIASDLAPDWAEPPKRIVFQLSEIPNGRATWFAARQTQRQPYDGGKLKSLLQVQVMYRSNPVGALATAAAIRSRAPDTDFGNMDQMAWRNLGATAQAFEHEYSRTSGLGNSLRYIDWYESAREAVDADRPRPVVNIDNLSVSTRLENGTVETRTFHPLSGALVRMEIGPYWVQAETDAYGDQITTIRSSGGQTCTAQYEGSPAHLSGMALPDGRSIKIEYGPDHRISKLTLNGTGSLVVHRDARGTIERVDSLDEQGNPVSASQAGDHLAKLRSAFDQIALLQGTPDKQALAWRHLVVPVDTEKDRLIHIAESGQLAARLAPDQAGIRTDALNATLNAVAHLRVHQLDDPDNVRQFVTLLGDMFDLVEETSDQAIAHRITGEIIKPWYESSRELFAAGLNAERWDQWQRMLNWLHRRGGDVGGDTVNALELLAAIEREPLAQASQPRWLARSFLTNPGYWTRHQRSEIPAPSGWQPSALLIRKSGDIVLGTTKGLCVGRAGEWRWYGFDESARRWRSDIPLANLHATSEVLALAEFQNGNGADALWIGTPNGLIVISEDYESSVRWDRTSTEGLPANRVEELVWSPEGPLVQTTAGLILANAAQWKAVPASLGKPECTLRMTSIDRLVEVVTPQPMLDLAKQRSATEAQLHDLDTAINSRRGIAHVVRSVFQDEVERASDEDLEAQVLRYCTQLQTKASPIVVAANEEGVFVWSESGLQQISGEHFDEAIYVPELSAVVMRRGQELFSAPWPSQSSSGHATPLPGQQDIVRSKQTYRLAVVLIENGVQRLAVLTDQGMSFFDGRSFEHLDPPLGLSDRHVGILHVAERGLSLALMSTDGVFEMSRGQASTLATTRVYDIASVPGQHRVYVALGNEGLTSLQTDSTVAPALKPARSGDVQHIVIDKQGRVIISNNDEIQRLDDPESGVWRTLFQIERSTDVEPAYAGVNSLLADSRGAIWATAGPYLYRWTEGVSAPTRFSMFDDSRIFPSRSDMLATIVETIEGRIWVVASSESHRYFDGLQLTGGILEFDGEAFHRLPIQDQSPTWFLTSYTPIDGNEAIVGTLKGFASHRDGTLVPFRNSKDVVHSDPSYVDLYARTPLLWQGTRGARLGNMWLFGSAAGVVAYYQNDWFYPESLNWMLPDQMRSQYGGRHVYAVATDDVGRIYVGTARGLLVYSGFGRDPESFLAANGQGTRAFGYAERRRLSEELDAFRRELPAESPGAMALNNIERLREDIDRLRRRMVRTATSNAAPQEGSGRQQAGESSVMNDTLGALQEKERAYRNAMLMLKQQYPALQSLLPVDPLDFPELQRNLRSNQALVMYVPTDDQLLSIVIRHNQSPSLHRMQIGSANLVAAIQAATAKLHQPVAGAPAQPAATEALLDDLAFLYDQLLRPLEANLQDSTQVLIVPTKELCYLPFAALVRARSPLRYAVQDWSFGYIMSPRLLSFFNLVGSDATRTSATVIGRIADDLPHAGEEFDDVCSKLKLLVDQVISLPGDRATIEGVYAALPTARFVHFSTHASLDASLPQASGLRLWGGGRLTLADCMGLPLRGCELVVLSACQTAQSSGGLEFSNLSLAFVNAGATNVLATLWLVDDQATSLLMRKFYDARQKADSIAALNQAQRQMIQAGGETASPCAWAHFILLGRG